MKGDILLAALACAGLVGGYAAWWLAAGWTSNTWLVLMATACGLALGGVLGFYGLMVIEFGRESAVTAFRSGWMFDAGAVAMVVILLGIRIDGWKPVLAIALIATYLRKIERARAS